MDNNTHGRNQLNALFRKVFRYPSCLSGPQYQQLTRSIHKGEGTDKHVNAVSQL